MILLFTVLLAPCSVFAGDLEKEMQEALKKSRLIITDIQDRIDKGSSIVEAVQHFRAQSRDVRAIHMLLSERYARHQDKADAFWAEAAERNMRMTEKYRQRMSRYLEEAENIKSEDVSNASLEAIKKQIGNLVYKKKWPVFGTLPYRHLNFSAKLPKKEPVIVPAYRGGTIFESEDDLASSPAAPVSKEIAEFAGSLDWNPVQIYEWVKNNVKTEWYWGSMKGAEETLRQKSGNDSDQAALLVSLLRASGYGARFVRGTIKFFPGIETAKNLTGIDDEVVLASFFQKSGIPYTPVISRGKISNFEIEHIWVESFIPYANYRGGVIDENGRIWIAMDTSIKAAGFVENTPEKIPVELDVAGMVDSYLMKQRPETPLAYVKGLITAYLEENHAGKRYEDFLLKRDQNTEVMNIVPASLQYEQVAITGEYTALPDDLIHKVQFVAESLDSAHTFFDIVLETQNLSNRKITVTYNPETVEDQELINSYGGLDNTPAYLVRLRPLITCDGEDVAVGHGGLPMGSEYKLKVRLLSPSGTRQFTNTHVAGNLSVMGIVSQNALIAEQAADERRTAEEIYYKEALSYIDRWNRAEEELAALLKISMMRPLPSVVTIGGVADVGYLVDSPQDISWKGVYVDANFRRVETVGENTKTFMRLSSLEGSVLESRLLEDAFKVEGISTAKLLAVARERNLSVETIDGSNIETALPNLDVPDHIKEDIYNTVNQGLTVIIPRRLVSYEDWTGIGYIKENMETGESGWMLSGMIAGGMTVWAPEKWDMAEFDSLLAPYSLPCVTDPNVQVSIIKVPACDRGLGTAGEMYKNKLSVIVRDMNNNPVKGAVVTFTAKAGGGRFSNNRQVMTAEPTNLLGVTGVAFTPGERTSNNKAYRRLNGSDEYSTQVGMNIIDAQVASGESIPSPFVVYGVPGEPSQLLKVVGGNDMGHILSWTGYVCVTVADKYGNPVSNVPVDFSARRSSPSTDNRQARLVPMDAPCIEQIPVYGQCGSSTLSDIKTSCYGALAHVILGGTPDAEYKIDAVAAGMTGTFSIRSLYLEDIEDENDIELVMQGIQATLSGKKLNGVPVDSSIKIKVKSYVLKEDDSGKWQIIKDYDGNVYIAEKTFDTNSSGYYEYDYDVGSIPKYHSVGVSAVANYYSSNRVKYEKYVHMNVGAFGVDVQWEDSLKNSDGLPKMFIPLDPDGFSTCDSTLSYKILPESYEAASARVLVHVGGRMQSYMAVETSGSGFGTLAKGYHFDQDQTCNAGVVLNESAGAYEIKSDDIAVHTDDVEILPIHIKDDKYPISSGDTAVALAETKPSGRKLIWTVEYAPEGVDAQIINPATGVITVGPETESGYIRVRATDAQIPCLFRESLVFVGCPSCVSGACSVEGAGVINLSSIDARFSMGKAKGGKSAGDLFLKAEEMSPDLATPRGLEFFTLARGVESVFDEDEAIRQVLAPKTFVDIVILDEFSYEIRFYRPDQIKGKTDTLYELADNAEPFTLWRVENPDRSKEEYNRLNLIEVKDGTEKTYEYAWDESFKTWSLGKGNGKQVTVKQEGTDTEFGDRYEITTVKSREGGISSVEKRVWHKFAWGEEIVRTVTDPNGYALATLTAYYEAQELKGSYGKVKSVTRSDGSKTVYTYDEKGRIKSVESSLLDGEKGKKTLYGYEPVDAGDAGSEADESRPRVVTETIQGQTVSKRYHAYLENGAGERIEITERCSTPESIYGSPDNLRTVRTYFPSGTDQVDSGKIKSVAYPDGRLDSYLYEKGSFTGEENETSETVTHGTVSHPEGIANRTTRDESISSEMGNGILSRILVYTGSGWDELTRTEKTYDAFDRLRETIRSDGTKTSAFWGCCSMESETDASGITRHFTYDELNRMEAVETEGLKGKITITSTFDASGRKLTETVSAGGLSLASTTAFDTAGRISISTNSAGLVVSYAYDAAGLTATVTRPGGATEITTRYRDGRTKSVTGTGVIQKFYTYGVNDDGSRWTLVRTGREDSPMWEKTVTDMLGRTVRVEKPGFTGVEITENFYNRKGRLERTIVTGQADVIYLYDETGAQVRSGLDLDGNHLLEPESEDRITDTESLYTQIDFNWWQETRQKVYAVAGSAVATETGAQLSQVTGLGEGGKISESVSIDVSGNRTVSRAFVDPEKRTVTSRTDYPDSDSDGVTVSRFGLTLTSIGKTGHTVTYDYDALGRRTGVIDPRTGAAVTHYDDNGRVDSVTDAAGNKTQFIYDPIIGRKKVDINALNKATRYAYNVRGQVTHTWGDAAYPVKYVYDGYGRMEKMLTYRTGENWGGESFSENVSGDATSWHYQEATGLLLSKEDAGNKKTEYTYTTAGKLLTRTWARKQDGDPIVTTYAYDSKTGELVRIDYSDGTSDVRFSYDRLGRQKKVVDVSGERTFHYNSALQLEKEIMTGLLDVTLTRTYDDGAVKGRATGFHLNAGYGVTYGYDTKGRFGSVDWQAGTKTGSVTYGYLENSDLLKTASAGSGNLATYSYEPHRNLKTGITNSFGPSVISEYIYGYDAVGRRTSVKNSGTAFIGSAFNRYGYNDRNELTESSRYLSDDVENMTQPVQSEYRKYNYDPMGNRQSAVEGTENLGYEANAVNQYSTIIQGNQTENLIWDDDGNLTSAEGKGYTWNAENRLTSVEPAAPQDGDKKLVFSYDYMGRRIKKELYTFKSGVWQFADAFFYIYDGWNLIQELDGGETVRKSYVWGLDLSQSLQGAGGIGGLVASVDASTSNVYHYNYDANGNVGQLTDGAGAVEAHYEYDPFGNSVVIDGDYAGENAFRFSTKYWDDKSALYYYGYRYYVPESGRWIRRDPIEEEGGNNLYQFVFNDSVNKFDNMGLEVLAVTHDDSNLTFIMVDSNRVGFIENGQRYLVPSIYNNGKTNIIVTDYAVTFYEDGKYRSRRILSDLIYENKWKIINKENKDRFKQTVSLIFASAGPISKGVGASKNTTQIFENIDKLLTSVSVGENVIKRNWNKTLYELLGYAPVLSIFKTAFDIGDYKSNSLEPFEIIYGKEFKMNTDPIDLTCEILNSGHNGQRPRITYSLISKAIKEYHLKNN